MKSSVGKFSKHTKGFRRYLLATASAVVFLSPTASALASTVPIEGHDWQTNLRAGPPSASVELMQYRTPRSQTFLNPNGSFTTKLYPIPVFYRDASGHWQPINNSLTSNHASKFTNQAGPLRTTFPQSLASGAAIAVSPGGSQNGIDMSLIGETETVPATVKGNSISYPNVQPGVDLAYAMQADHVKESIILQSATAPTTFSFLLHAPGITFSELQDGSIVGKNAQGNSLYTIPAPFMTDARGAMSKAVTSALSTNSQGDTVLTVS